MEKTLYLHIGTEKTGSTAIQAVSGANRGILAKHGILYPKAPGEKNHVMLAIYAGEKPNVLDLRRVARLFAESAYQQFKVDFPGALRSEVDASSCERICLSNEHLSSRLKSSKDIERLAELVRPLAKAVKIVVYLRPQPELFLSSYSTHIKAGKLKPLEPPKIAQHFRYNYDNLLSLWADVFGEKNIIVKIYDRKSLIGGDVVKDFYSIMNYEPGNDLTTSTTVNGRLDLDGMRFLLEFNRHVPTFLEDSVNPERADIAAALEAASREHALPVSGSVLRAIAKLYEDSNARVARRFLDNADGRLFPPVQYPDEAAGSGLTVERAIEIAAHLWRWKQKEVSRLKAQLTATRKQSSPKAKRPSR